MDYILLTISIAYTTAMGLWLMNHVRSIYNHQFEVTDAIIARLTETKSTQELTDKDYLYGEMTRVVMYKRCAGCGAGRIDFHPYMPKTVLEEE